jgi:F-type H+-transporting ATPase subunit a
LRKFCRLLTPCIFLICLSSEAYASGVVVQFVDFYHSLLHSFGLSEDAIKQWVAVPGAIVTVSIVILLGLKFRSHCAKAESEVVPTSLIGVMPVIEMVLDFVAGVAKEIIGPDRYKEFLTVLSGLFVFILISNLCGLVPGFHPTTLSLNTNLAMGLSVFIYYNWAGFKEHGSHYIHQFMGPIAWMVPLMLVIELIAHLARPLSLSVRLYGNIFGDHLVLSVFTGLTWLVFPAFFMFFGLLVALIQSFVFTLLSSIYIALAISHDH